MKYILVTGGCGFIGSHCILEILKNFNEGCGIVVLDNFSNSEPGMTLTISTENKKENDKREENNKKEEKAKNKVFFHKIDITNEDSVQKIFDKYVSFSIFSKITS